MQTLTRTSTIEQMLESADHLIEKHRADPAIPDRITDTPHLPQGWILYSAERAFGGSKKGWNVELMDTTKPFQKGSIVTARHNHSLDAALEKASRSIMASRPAGRA
jgi:hypothetical protein